MADDDDFNPDFSDPLADALLAHLIRKGILDDQDGEEIAARLEAIDQPTAAHMARCAIMRAHETPQSDFIAQRLRSRFRIVPADGGNEGS